MGTLDRSKLLSMATGNYAGKLFTLAGNLYMPILVANQVSAADAAYFFVPWMVSLAIELVALNVMTSLTVEAATDMPQLRRLSRRALGQSMRLVIPIAALRRDRRPLGAAGLRQAYADEGASLLRLLALGVVPNVIVTLGISVARIEHRGGIVVAIQGAHLRRSSSASAPCSCPTSASTRSADVWTGSQMLLALVLLATMLRPLVLPGRLAGRRAGATA